MPIRKIDGFNPSEISLPQDSLADAKSDASAIEASADAIETTNSANVILGDTFGFEFPSLDWSGASVPEPPKKSPFESHMVDSPLVPHSDFADDVERFNLGIVLPQDDPPQMQKGPSLDGMLPNGLPDLGFNGGLVPDVKVVPETFKAAKFLESPSATASGRELDSISFSAYTDQQLVEDLLNQIKGLLQNLPQDQQAYWQAQFDQLSKNFFYEARATDSFGNINTNNLVYYPRPADQVNWQAALQDFSAFLEQLQAAQ